MKREDGELTHKGQVPTVLIALFVLTAISGRFTLDRALVESDIGTLGSPRFWLLALLTLLYLGMRAMGWGTQTEKLPGYFLTTVLLFHTYVAVSSLWSEAIILDLVPAIIDTLLLPLLALMAALVVRSNPEESIQRLFVIFFLVSLIYLVGAVGEVGTPSSSGRTAAFWGGPNVFTRIMATGIIAGTYLFLSTGRLWWLLALPGFAVGIILSGSRGGFVAFILAGMVGLIPMRRGIRSPKLILTIVGLSALFVVVGFQQREQVLPVLEERFYEQTFEQRYTAARIDLFKEAVNLFVARPVLGAGLEGFHATVGSLGIYPHNIVLAIAAEGGLVGLLFFSISIVAWAHTYRKQGSHSKESIACSVAAFYYFCASLFSGGFYDTRFVWIFLTIALLPDATLKSSYSQVRHSDPSIAGDEPGHLTSGRLALKRSRAELGD